MTWFCTLQDWLIYWKRFQNTLIIAFKAVSVATSIQKCTLFGILEFGNKCSCIFIWVIFDWIYFYSIITKAKQSFKNRLLIRKESDRTENVELTTDLNDINGGAGNGALVDDEPPMVFQNGCSSTVVETVNSLCKKNHF